MKIRRDVYLNRLIELKHNGLVKVITGIRRCGKSYLLFKLFREHLRKSGVDARHVIEINLDDEREKALRDPIRLGEHIRARLPKDRKPRYVFIDEIQLCRKVRDPSVDLSKLAPEDRGSAYITFYDVLNELMKLPRTDVYVTGSNSKMLSKDVATNFRDRGVEVRMHPLSFGEYLGAVKDEKAVAWERYLIWGGMPLAVLEDGEASRAKYLQDLFAKVYVRDICERHKLKSDYVLGKVVDVLSSSVGSLTNPNRLVNALKTTLGVKTSNVTLKKYLDYLQDSFLFTSVKRFDVKGRHYLDYPEKFYAEDVGLRNARMNFRQTERSHLMENIIYNELVFRGCNVDVGVVPVEVREGERVERRQYEIDFIVNLGVQKIYVQSAFAIPDDTKMQQETRSLKKSGDFFRKIVVRDGFMPPLADEDGIIHVGVIPFLLDRAILTGGS